MPQSINQEQVWTHVQMMGDTPAYNELATLHHRGALEVGALERALDEVVRRHESFRTTFEMGEDEPLQVIHDSSASVKLRVLDLRSLPLKEREKESVRLATDHARASFNLKVLPLWRAILVRVADDRHQLHLTVHHSILDGAALYGLFLTELIAIYDAFSAAKPSPLPEPELQYADYSEWQRQRLTDETIAPQLAFWKKKLAPPAAPLHWPNSKPRPAVQTYRGATEMLSLPAHVIDPLRALAAAQSTTLFMALAAGYFVLLHRYTGQTDITLGTPTASRTPDSDAIMGYFLNLMPVRVDLSGNPAFSQVVQLVRASFLDALEYGSVPLLRILREVRPAYDPSRNALFQIMISLQPPMPKLDPAWDLTQSAASSGSTKMDMYLNLEVRPDGLNAPIIYNPDLLDATEVRQMFADWRAVLEGAIAQPDCLIADLPLAPKALRKDVSLTGRLRRWLGRWQS